MKKKVIFFILDQFADWEHAFLSTSLQFGINGKESAFEVKTASVGKEPVKSNGGFCTIPDYDINCMPEDYAGLVLVGGYSWFHGDTKEMTEDAKKVIPLVERTLNDKRMLGAICNATVFLGMGGFLNSAGHTSNGLENLTHLSGEKYSGKARYQNAPSVRDGNLVTANGTAFLEFARECLLALDAWPKSDIESNYAFFKDGICR